jgi:WS/DGAT/MGAT family acyltransferase
MREIRDVDLDYHVRHSALPHPGGQRELGILVSRLHSHQLDLHRPLWEVHLIEGLEGNRFALYSKMHHSLIDGVSGMRMIMRALSTDPNKRGMPAFWTVGAGERPPPVGAQDGSSGLLGRSLAPVRSSATALMGLSRAALDLGRAAIDDRALQAPYRAPRSPLGEHLGGQRRFATQQYELDRIKALARAADCTLNDIVLYLSGSALRRYLAEHGRVPERPLTAGIPVNLRESDDQSMGTAVGMMVAELGTNIANPAERLEAIRRSTAEAKRHLRELPAEARTSYTLLINGPYLAGLIAGLGGRAPIPFNVGISNVPGPTEPLYFNGSRLDALFPLSLLLHGNALNITCVSYAGTLNFGFTGARDTLPHLQRLAVYMGDAVEEIERILLGRVARSVV